MSTRLIDNPDRLRKVFARLDAKDESGQAVAFNIASKALASAGVTWADLLEAHLTISQRGNAFPGTFSDAFNGIFNDLNNKAAQAAADRDNPFKAAAKEKSAPFRDADWRRKIYVTGSEIPGRVAGKVRELDRRQTRRGTTMLVVQVETESHIYGPMNVFDENQIRRLEMTPDAIFEGVVVHSDNPVHAPQFKLWGRG